MTVTVDPARREAARRALALDDAALLAECVEEFFVAGGPGGQHRNKTASGVRLTHPPTEFTVTAVEGSRSTLAVDIITGRKHQIRRHLAGIGHPVVGDWRYGSGGEKLALTAVELAFRCPLTGAARSYRCPPTTSRL